MPVDSIATLLILHSLSQSAIEYKSHVNAVNFLTLAPQPLSLALNKKGELPMLSAKLYYFAISIIILLFCCICFDFLEAKENDQLQFVSSNHVLSFGKKSIHVASKNHMLKMNFIGSNDVVPKEKSTGNAGNISSSGEKIKELNTIIYSELWDGVTVKYEKNKGSILKSTYTIKLILTDFVVENN